jgi:hypothetical protein
VLHAQPISSIVTLSFYLYLEKSRSYEAPHYVVFSNLLSLHLFSVQIFSSAPCTQTPVTCCYIVNERSCPSWAPSRFMNVLLSGKRNCHFEISIYFERSEFLTVFMYFICIPYFIHYAPFYSIHKRQLTE